MDTDKSPYVRRACHSCRCVGEHEFVSQWMTKCANCGNVQKDTEAAVPRSPEPTERAHRRILARPPVTPAEVEAALDGAVAGELVPGATRVRPGWAPTHGPCFSCATENGAGSECDESPCRCACHGAPTPAAEPLCGAKNPDGGECGRPAGHPGRHMCPCPRDNRYMLAWNDETQTLADNTLPASEPRASISPRHAWKPAAPPPAMADAYAYEREELDARAAASPPPDPQPAALTAEQLTAREVVRQVRAEAPDGFGESMFIAAWDEADALVERYAQQQRAGYVSRLRLDAAERQLKALGTDRDAVLAAAGEKTRRMSDLERQLAEAQQRAAAGERVREAAEKACDAWDAAAVGDEKRAVWNYMTDLRSALGDALAAAPVEPGGDVPADAWDDMVGRAEHWEMLAEANQHNLDNARRELEAARAENKRVEQLADRYGAQRDCLGNLLRSLHEQVSAALSSPQPSGREGDAK